MIEIAENESLEMTNVLTYRGKITQQQSAIISKEMNDIISANNAQKTMIGVSATYEIINSGSETIMDVEIMYPLDKYIDVTSPYKIKPIFRLKNAVRIRHEGNPVTIQNTVNELMQYISTHGLTPITPGYNVTIKEPKNPSDIDSMIVDIYVGVNDNIL